MKPVLFVYKFTLTSSFTFISLSVPAPPILLSLFWHAIPLPPLALEHPVSSSLHSFHQANTYPWYSFSLGFTLSRKLNPNHTHPSPPVTAPGMCFHPTFHVLPVITLCDSLDAYLLHCGCPHWTIQKSSYKLAFVEGLFQLGGLILVMAASKEHF